MKANVYLSVGFAVILVVCVFSSANSGQKPPLHSGGDIASTNYRGIDLTVSLQKVAGGIDVTISETSFETKVILGEGRGFTGILVARSSFQVDPNKIDPELKNYKCVCTDFTYIASNGGYVETKHYNSFTAGLPYDPPFYYAAGVSHRSTKYRERKDNNTTTLGTWDPAYNCSPDDSDTCKKLYDYFKKAPTATFNKIGDKNKPKALKRSQ